MDPVTEFFLFLAQRKEVRNVVAERLVQGMNVISDRSDSSTFAFQICGRGLSNLTTFFFHSMKFFDPKPDLYIILDVPAEVAKERITKRAQEDGKTDRIDNEALEFHTRVRNGFYLFRDNIDVPCAFVDATRSPHVVAAEVVNLVSRVLVKVSS
jgi:dTMP kinase